jgi:hypothetical protein
MRAAFHERDHRCDHWRGRPRLPGGLAGLQGEVAVVRRVWLDIEMRQLFGQRRFQLAIEAVVMAGTQGSGPVPPVRPGQVLHLKDEDYQYGRGPMTLRVTAILGILQLSDGPWVNVRGIPLGRNGYEYDERQALVRVAALA